MVLRSRSAILTLVAAALVASTLAAEEAPPAQPHVDVPEPVKQAGKFLRGERIAHEFVVKNTGAADLMLLDARAQAGGTITHYDRKIAPGGTGKVSVEVDTLQMLAGEGAVNLGIVLLTNDPTSPQARLLVTAEVRSTLKVTPGYARYATVQFEREGTIVQNVWATDAEDFQVLEAISPIRYLRTSLREARPDERQADAVGRQWRVETTLASDAPIGDLTGYLTLRTNHPRESSLRIPLSGFVRPVFAITPTGGDFGELALAQPTRWRFTVRNFASEAIPVTLVPPQIPGLQTELVTLEQGRRYELLVTLEPSLPKGPFRATLELQTPSPKQPKLELSFWGTLR